MFPFRNNTFGYGCTMLNYVIPKLVTIAVSTNTTNKTVVFGICPKVWCRLPKQGVLVLEVRQNADTTGATLPVYISTTGGVSPVTSNGNLPLVSANSNPILGSQIKSGNRYWIYYNKCDGIMQMMNYSPSTATPTAATK